MAFKAINDSIGLNSLISTLLVFRAYPYIIEFDVFNPTVIKSIPVKAYNLIRIVKHYYSPLYCIYYIIIIKLLDISKDIAL